MTSKDLLLTMLVLFFLGCTSISPKVKTQNITENNSINYKHTLPNIYNNKSFLYRGHNKHLQNYLHEVLQNNNDLNALALTKKSLALGMKVTRANTYPSGDITLNHSKNKEGINAKFQNRISTDITMHWDLDLWGKLSDEYKASKQMYHSMEHRYAYQRRILLLNATIDWINYWYILNVIKNQKLLLKKYANLTKHNLEVSNAGLRDRYFYLEARRTQELIQSSLFNTELDLVKVRQQLNVYRGVAPNRPLSMELSHEVLPLKLDVKKTHRVNSYIAQRDDVQQSLSQLKATKFLEKAAYKALLPQINISFSASKSVESLSKLLSGELLWEFIGGMAQPVFHAYQLQTLAEQKSLETGIAWRNYKEVVLQALLEVQSALVSETVLKRQLRHKEHFYENLLNSLKSSKEKTIEGISDFADYLQEEANAIDEKNNLLMLKAAYAKNRLHLMSALGFPLVVEENVEKNKDR